ncbi:unnamed protein product [Linum tenue]|uniref:Uncharacterized protein n=1 Tax=Linum tenue TaxID=586396 RepID=A0AAV0Q2N8_9ROSI|nr:unnamed protein product [Linum tenue]
MRMHVASRLVRFVRNNPGKGLYFLADSELKTFCIFRL